MSSPFAEPYSDIDPRDAWTMRQLREAGQSGDIRAQATLRKLTADARQAAAQRQAERRASGKTVADAIKRAQYARESRGG